jgi:hypothetical protein
MRVLYLAAALGGTSLSACEATGANAWTLQLAPIQPDGQALFGGDAELVVRVASPDPDAPPTLTRLGPSSSSTWELPDIADLVDATVGLMLIDPNGGIDPLDYADLRAFGQTPPITLDDGERTVPVVVAGYGQPGRLGALGPANRALGGALAQLANGDVYLFGGTDDVVTANSAASDQVLRLDRGDDDLVFTRVGTIPSWPTDPSPRTGATATPVQFQGREVILVAGGRKSFTPTNQGRVQSFLWDPDAEAALDVALPLPGAPRSGHTAIPLSTGDVALLGGFSDNPANEGFTWDLYRAADARIDAASDGEALPNVGYVGFGVAPLGDDQLLVCGGGSRNGQLTLDPSPGCVRLDAQGIDRPAPDIADGVADADPPNRVWHAMAPLADGRILLCGGVARSIEDNDTAAAVDDAFVYDPASQRWSRVGDLKISRAMHALIPLPDGRVLVLGGTSAAFGIAPPDNLGDFINTPEVFDPTTERFTKLDTSPVGTGALPALAFNPAAPGHGVFALAGAKDAQEGGEVYGVIGLAP